MSALVNYPHLCKTTKKSVLYSFITMSFSLSSVHRHMKREHRNVRCT